MNPRELEQEIQKAFDGELSESGAEALREALRNSPGALDVYCEHAILASELRRHAANRSKIPGTIPYRTRFAELMRHRRMARLALSAAAAVLLVGGLVMHAVWQAPRPKLVGVQTAAGSVLRTAEGEVFTGDSLEFGRRLMIGQGVARLSFRSGVDAIIEGPATLNVVHAGKIELAGGGSWFHVPPEARGFEVDCPGFTVTDLGTEFGVDLREDLPAQVHVMLGEVEAKARFGHAASIRLRAGSAAILSPTGRWETGPADPSKFRSRLPGGLPEVKMDFETLADGRLDLAGDAIGVSAASARIVGNGGARLVPGVDGMALDLAGGGAHIETTWQGISGSAPRTVALWCRVPEGATFATAPALALWGNPALGFNRKFKVALCTTVQGTIMRTSFGDTLIDGITPVADGLWHHLAVVYRGNHTNGQPDISMFIDGRPEPVTMPKSTLDPIGTDIAMGVPLQIGQYELGRYGRSPYLVATLDCFRVFAGALTEAEIGELAKIPGQSEKTR